ncbi:MAG: hypothetical protein J0G32_05110 [Alphaproteobacteria bacterium]|nr:hypothetical protein [Alphaproteobacteria bacterium]OJV13484.1 MAG: hypothetical protein BGO27_04670 [Alphaproteobacteria bacterium 33-17]
MNIKHLITLMLCYSEENHTTNMNDFVETLKYLDDEDLTPQEIDSLFEICNEYASEDHFIALTLKFYCTVSSNQYDYTIFLKNDNYIENKFSTEASLALIKKILDSKEVQNNTPSAREKLDNPQLNEYNQASSKYK